MLVPFSAARPHAAITRQLAEPSPTAVAPRTKDRGQTSALEQLPRGRRSTAMAAFEPPSALLPARAGERSAELVEQYMAKLGCTGASGPLAACPAGRSADPRAAITRQFDPHREQALLRHLRAYCRGLASAVAEVIRHDPEMEAFARAAGERMARQAASPLAQGRPVQPPDFYEVARETSARFEADRQRRSQGRHHR